MTSKSEHVGMTHLIFPHSHNKRHIDDSLVGGSLANYHLNMINCKMLVAMSGDLIM